MPPTDPEAAFEALAEELVEEALSRMALPAPALPALRATLLAELLATAHGRASLRHVMADARVQASGDVALGPEGDAAGGGGVGGAAADDATRTSSGGGRG